MPTLAVRTGRPCSRGLRLGQPDPADLGIGERHPGQAVVAVVVAAGVREVRGQHGRLEHRHVGEGAAAGDVADREQPVDRCAVVEHSHLLVDVDRAPVVGQPDRTQPDVEVGLAPGRDEQPLGGQGLAASRGSARRRRRRPPTAVVRAPVRTSTPSRRSTSVDDRRRLGLLLRQDARAALEHGHLRARTGPSPAPARCRSRRRRSPATTAGTVADPQDLAVGPDQSVRPGVVTAQFGQPGDRRDRRRRAGREHHPGAPNRSPATSTSNRPSSSRPTIRPAPARETSRPCR